MKLPTSFILVCTDIPLIAFTAFGKGVISSLVLWKARYPKPSFKNCLYIDLLYIYLSAPHSCYCY